MFTTPGPLPEYYVALLIQSFNIEVDNTNNYLRFNITNHVLYQNYILIEIGACVSNPDCFVSATIRYVCLYDRMLAVDYDKTVDSVTYS
jgi:hypothetical protein